MFLKNVFGYKFQKRTVTKYLDLFLDFIKCYESVNWGI